MLRELVPDRLWVAEMPASKGGFEFGARMTAVRLPDGGLWVHSPTELSPVRRQVEAAGPVRALVAPSGMHYEHVPEWAAAFPEARVFAVEGTLKHLQGRVQVDGILGDEPDPLWAGAIEQAPLQGSRLYDEVDFFHPATRTLILTDLCFNIPPERGWSTRFWARLLGVFGKLSLPRSFGLTLRDRAAAAASLERILAWDFDRVLLTHGDLVETGGKAAFRAAVSRFLPPR